MGLQPGLSESEIFLHRMYLLNGPPSIPAGIESPLTWPAWEEGADHLATAGTRLGDTLDTAPWTALSRALCRDDSR